jgi:hypothetical protein
MKAAVLHEYGAVPRYEDFPDPVAGDGEVVVEVKAVAVENVDKAIAAGTHFAARQFLPELPGIVGFDGIGTLADGTLVGFGQPRPPYGVIPAHNTTPAPEGIDPAVAVVISSAVTGFGLGADAVINTAASDDALVEAFAAEAGGGYDVVLDFLWGRPTAGKGLDGQAVADAYGQIVQWTRDGKLVVGIDRTPLSDIETAWQRTDLGGRRLVITP